MTRRPLNLVNRSEEHTPSGTTQRTGMKEALAISIFDNNSASLLGGVKAYYELFHSWGLQYGLFVGLVALYVMGGRGRLTALRFDSTMDFDCSGTRGTGTVRSRERARQVCSFVYSAALARFVHGRSCA